MSPRPALPRPLLWSGFCKKTLCKPWSLRCLVQVLASLVPTVLGLSPLPKSSGTRACDMSLWGIFKKATCKQIGALKCLERGVKRREAAVLRSEFRGAAIRAPLRRHPRLRKKTDEDSLLPSFFKPQILLNSSPRFYLRPRRHGS